jgi:hypothetical protein
MKHINEVIKANGSTTKLQGDRNYCTVTALSATFSISANEAHEYAAKAWGRKKSRGVATAVMLRSFPMAEGFSYAKDVMGKDVVRIKAEQDYKQPDGSIKTRSMNLSTFAKKHPRGKFYILVKGHALAIIDGEIVDHTDKPKRRVYYAWKVD